MSNYFSLCFDDLTYTKQEDLIETVSQYLLDKWKEKTKGIENWEMKYMIDNGIKKDYWWDEETALTKFGYDWKWNLKDYAQDKAKGMIIRDIKYLELEVDCDN